MRDRALGLITIAMDYAVDTDDDSAEYAMEPDGIAVGPAGTSQRKFRFMGRDKLAWTSAVASGSVSRSSRSGCRYSMVGRIHRVFTQSHVRNVSCSPPSIMSLAPLP